jgi:hypothetical protein
MSAIDNLNELAENTTAGIARLQTVEKNLYDKLRTTPADSDAAHATAEQLSSVSRLKHDLLRLIENAEQFVQKEAKENVHTLRKQLEAVRVMETSLRRMDEVRGDMKVQNTDMLRNAENSRRYGDVYRITVDLVKIVAIGIIPAIVLTKLLGWGIISSSVYMLLLVLVILAGVVKFAEKYATTQFVRIG